MPVRRAVGTVAAVLAFLLAAGPTLWGYTLPPTPTTYLTDDAHVIDAGTATAVDQQLDQFERDTSNQILVAIYPALPDDAEIAQYCAEAFAKWGVGQKTKNNGAVLFVFVNSHQMFISTGRGLEGALPDIICKRIVRDEITPPFKQGNYSAGVQAGVNAMLAATKGEYKGNGSTNDDQNQTTDNGNPVPTWIIILVILLFILARIFIFPRFGGPMIYTGGGYGGGGGFGGGGFGGGGGGFSGGGGGTAGGGAGGSW